MARRYYVTPDGHKYPLHEAPYDYRLWAYASDCPKAIIADPSQCLIALGALRDKSILSAHIGSGGDAYLVFKATKLRAAYALHFTLKSRAKKIRDNFEMNKRAKTQVIELSAPTAGRTLDHRSALGKRRRAAIKAGAPVRKNTKPPEKRITRIGHPHRPTPKIVGNVVTIPRIDEEAAA